MVTKDFPDDEKSKNPNPSENPKKEPELSDLFNDKDDEVVPAFKFSDDEDLDAMRRAMIEKEANQFIADNPVGSESAENSSKQQENPDQSQPEFVKWLSNLETPGDPSPTPSPDSGDEPDQFFTTFEEDIFTKPAEAFAPADENSEGPSLTEETSKEEFPWLWKDDNPENTESDELGDRLNTLRASSDQNLPNDVSITPPFVMDDIFSLDENNDTLPERIRKGLVPAETIELLITSTMSEDDVIAISKELGIDWTLIPENTRQGKIEFLVNYFKNKDNEQLQDAEIMQPRFLSMKTEEDWRESDSRLKALQESFNIPEAPISKPRRSFFNRSDEDSDSPSSSLVRGMILGAIAVILILVGVVGYFIYANRNVIPAQTAAPISSEVPIPAAMELPGGWAFKLNVGTVQEGGWKPSSAEWLQGSEVSRLVSLPWSKQLNAVVQTFEAGDSIQLTMSNQDILTFEVESVTTIKSDEINKLIDRATPSLIVILTQKESDNQQVVISNLVSTTLAPTPTTSTP